MNQLKLLFKANVVWFILSLLVACNIFETNFTTSTQPSSKSPTLIPTPSIHESEGNYSFLYPAGWYYKPSEESFLTIANEEHLRLRQRSYDSGEIIMGIINIPTDMPNGTDPMKALYRITNEDGIEMPDEEPAHVVLLNGKAFTIGTYSQEYISTAWRENRAPLFIAVYFTDRNTVVLNMYAGAGDKIQLRRVFEDLLMSMKDEQ